MTGDAIRESPRDARFLAASKSRPWAFSGGLSAGRRQGNTHGKITGDTVALSLVERNKHYSPLVGLFQVVLAAGTCLYAAVLSHLIPFLW